ncbi:cell division protein ZapA [Mariniphaga sediminis]|jgi:cell division protein ZapA|uniref:Cell division protein ZapA n=1 Tax=Mariniphaga sediminis TaxID=1628158 RepID=A0A399D9R3_9BACT|nr:cell division protein ZapA [Mariniphaga sediminis]RIH67041.1 cell division protein ZapA [Mariniphaga sediminis]
MNGDNEQLRINIRIEGRAYPLNIDRKDEERHRIAAKTVNETVNKYKELFQNKDSQDILAMAAFQIALNYVELKERDDKSLFIDGLKDLNDDISDFLKEKTKV